MLHLLTGCDKDTLLAREEKKNAQSPAGFEPKPSMARHVLNRCAIPLCHSCFPSIVHYWEADPNPQRPPFNCLHS